MRGYVLTASWSYMCILGGKEPLEHAAVLGHSENVGPAVKNSKWASFWTW